jgi:hypothetical protein
MLLLPPGLVLTRLRAERISDRFPYASLFACDREPRGFESGPKVNTRSLLILRSYGNGRNRGNGDLKWIVRGS